MEREIVRFGQGSGLPILMLHEGLGSVLLWRDFPDQLAAATGREVIAYSRQGYGQSGLFTAPYDLDFMHCEADGAASLMDKLGLGQAHIFGHSDGASIALLLAARHPQRVASLVLEAPHVFVEPMCVDAIKALKPDAAALVARLARYHEHADAVFRQWYAIWTDARFPDWTIEEDVIGISCPALVIQGDRDEYGSVAQVDRTCAALPQAEQLRLTDCGHSPHRDCLGEVLAASTQFYGDNRA